MKMQYGNYTFVLTRSVSPERYDIYSGGYLVGRVLLRFGTLTTHILTENLVFEFQLTDRYQGMFDSMEQRERFLRMISETLAAREATRV